MEDKHAVKGWEKLRAVQVEKVDTLKPAQGGRANEKNPWGLGA